MSHHAGVAAYKKCRSSGGSRREAARAFFDAEPAAKKLVCESPYFKSLGRQKTVPAEKVAEVVHAEEERYVKMLEKAPAALKKAFKDTTAITGEQLATVHHTMGYDPSVVEDVLGASFPFFVHDDYLTAYEAHRQKSKPHEKAV